MTTSQTPATGAAPRVDAGELARHIAEMYRDVANEAVDDLHFHTGRALAETLGYPSDLLDRLPARAVSSFAGVGYHLGLASLVAGEGGLDLGSGSAWMSSRRPWRWVRRGRSPAWTSRLSSSSRPSACAVTST